MTAQMLREALRDMALRHGFVASALVELEGGMVWHAEGDVPSLVEVASSCSDYWRLYRRSDRLFANLGELRVAVFFHGQARITVCECGPGMLLVVITAEVDGIDWTQWKLALRQLAQLVERF